MADPPVKLHGSFYEYLKSQNKPPGAYLQNMNFLVGAYLKGRLIRRGFILVWYFPQSLKEKKGINLSVN